MYFRIVTLVTLCTLFLSFTQASHFRFGAIQWFQPDPDNVFQVTFQVVTGWRKSFFPSVTIGATINPGTFCFVAGTCVSLNSTVTTVNLVDDWITASWERNFTYPSNVSTTATYIAFHSGSSRSNFIVNTPNQSWRIQTSVVISPTARNVSPVVSGLPIVTVPWGANTSHTIPATDPDGDQVSFFLATEKEQGTPNGTLVPGIVVNEFTGSVDLDTSSLKVNSFYQTQITIADSVGNRIPLDYLIFVKKLIKFCNQSCDNALAVCGSDSDCGICGETACIPSDPLVVSDPTLSSPASPENGATLSVFAGQSINFTLVAYDGAFNSTSKLVSITVSSVPAGSTLSAQSNCTEATNCSCPTCFNPVQRSWAWTPTFSDIGSTVICAGVTTAEGTPLSYGLHCVTIVVLEVNLCTTGQHDCPALANCIYGKNNFTCECITGYNGDGYNCTDIDECVLGTHTCPANAECNNTIGAFACACNTGFSGNGFNCSDINECTTGAHNCSLNASCTNMHGSYTCACRSGYFGDGLTCTQMGNGGNVEETECSTNSCEVSTSDAHRTSVSGLAVALAVLALLAIF